MNISSRCQYACRAMAELAAHAVSQETVNSMTIAQRHSIPEKYLVHILLQLKRARLVRSIRGARGGYVIGLSPDDITLLDIVEAIDGAVLSPLPVNNGDSAKLKRMWRESRERIEGILRSITVSDITGNVTAREMYHI